MAGLADGARVAGLRRAATAANVALLPLLLWCSPASAQTPAGDEEPAGEQAPAGDDPVARAAAAFERGKQAFEAGDYEQALAEFRQAQEDAPHDVVRFNIALCYERLGRYSEALAEYRHAAQSGQLDDEHRADAVRRAERMSAQLGHLVVQEPRGARVTVGGTERCIAPCTIDLDPGFHEVGVHGESADLTRTVEIAPGRTEEVQAPRRAPARAPSPSRRLRVGLIGWIGVGVAVAGSAGTLLYGVRASSLHSSYVDDPTRDRMESGRTAVTLTNVFLVTAILGAATFALDVLVLEPRWSRSRQDVALLGD